MHVESFEYIDEKGRIHRKYLSPVVDKTSICVDIYENEYKKKCNIDFRVHKSNGKIKGVYMMRIFKEKDVPLTLKYMDRNGYYTQDFSSLVTLYNESIRKNLEFGILTDELIDEIIDNTVKVIKVRALGTDRPVISSDIDLNISKKENIKIKKFTK
ncbi:MAG: hypothetical protein IKF01_00110 [Bacilli bacterium]|nr:hypothetical protein [Bacilli bacterium]